MVGRRTDMSGNGKADKTILVSLIWQLIILLSVLILWSSNTFATWCKQSTHYKRPWCWERLKAGGEGDNRGWDGWMASPTQWTWVWASCRRWWRTGKLGMLQSMGSQRVGHDWVTEQHQNHVPYFTEKIYEILMWQKL